MNHKGLDYKRRFEVVAVGADGGEKIVLIFPSEEAVKEYFMYRQYSSSNLSLAIKLSVKACAKRIFKRYGRERAKKICLSMTKVMEETCKQIRENEVYKITSVEGFRSCAMDDCSVDI
ncbi:MAG: hypothetical protein PHX30_00725 [Candidatus Pacebacteria bacterium]|nr:hypothetical protein [Candidatus Paceibacterota bacterium]